MQTENLTTRLTKICPALNVGSIMCHVINVCLSGSPFPRVPSNDAPDAPMFREPLAKARSSQISKHLVDQKLKLLHSESCVMRMCHVCKISCHGLFKLTRAGGTIVRPSSFRQCTYGLGTSLAYSFRCPLAKQTTKVTIASKSLNHRHFLEKVSTCWREVFADILDVVLSIARTCH